ncbi:MAG: hypothetical protein V1703_02000, partial [Candidatus Altiarchaeota archaeon]
MIASNANADLVVYLDGSDVVRSQDESFVNYLVFNNGSEDILLHSIIVHDNSEITLEAEITLVPQKETIEDLAST